MILQLVDQLQPALESPTWRHGAVLVLEKRSLCNITVLYVYVYVYDLYMKHLFTNYFIYYIISNLEGVDWASQMMVSISVCCNERGAAFQNTTVYASGTSNNTNVYLIEPHLED